VAAVFSPGNPLDLFKDNSIWRLHEGSFAARYVDVPAAVKTVVSEVPRSPAKSSDCSECLFVVGYRPTCKG